MILYSIHTLRVQLAHVVTNENVSLLKYAKHHRATVFVQLHGVYLRRALRTALRSALECVSVT